MESQSLRNVYATISTLTDVSDLFLTCSGDSLDCSMYMLILVCFTLSNKFYLGYFLIQQVWQ